MVFSIMRKMCDLHAWMMDRSHDGFLEMMAELVPGYKHVLERRVGVLTVFSKMRFSLRAPMIPQNDMIIMNMPTTIARMVGLVTRSLMDS